MIRFEVEFRDEFSDKIEKCNGIVAADSFGEAINRIEEYLGKDNLTKVNSLYWVETILEDRDLKDIATPTITD